MGEGVTVPWWRPTAEQRRRMSASCFLFPEARKYYICPPGSSRPTCRGTLAARRRAILVGSYEAEVRAIRRARILGCPWVQGAVAKHRRRARRAA